ncbi:hypothetical protein [Wenzhouxiangella marina]|uniref:Uncharacterized protein n=1 Tax=Wenzhouxiangella marina TaxID=1579979 RepID=A0A0K0XUG3_9GAMM|nr:hypothetical protein [Wenzhouxiangella marina]AKS41354.1 hypothetical protein WM2015_974 [Wenzhouxiangella marina]MBB6086895.1 hypothetical protein [Wenzhouxiangella marina]
MAINNTFGRIATSLLGALLTTGLNASVQPIDANSLPITLPPTSAYGLNFDVFETSGLRYQIRYTSEFGGTYRLGGLLLGFSETTEFLSCDNPDPQPGEPDSALFELASGQSIDNGLEDGICTFSSELSAGAINPGTFTGSNAFVGLRITTGAQAFFGYLQLRINGAGELELLGGAIEDSPDTAIETANSLDAIFSDRFGGASLTGLPAIASAIRLPHDPQFSLSVWLRDEPGADFEISAGAVVGEYQLDPGEGPGLERVLADPGASNRAIAVASGTLIDNGLVDGNPNQAWIASTRLVGTDFSAPEVFLPVRFTIIENFNFGYLGLQITANGDLLIRSGDWNPVSNQAITTP